MGQSAYPSHTGLVARPEDKLLLVVLLLVAISTVNSDGSSPFGFPVRVAREGGDYAYPTIYRYNASPAIFSMPFSILTLLSVFIAKLLA
ncbi:hypothetical protein WR25_24893 [Diploscapter pachys]|uniref:Uncharacterized protein n=1 Tax=Diploscapter pachys TaxID=2018661 RepID=A0A2A2LHP2_9BILA|nr:hypothetical protein WR25_24893 [Diploscapter pachys]